MHDGSVVVSLSVHSLRGAGAILVFEEYIPELCYNEVTGDDECGIVSRKLMTKYNASCANLALTWGGS